MKKENVKVAASEVKTEKKKLTLPNLAPDHLTRQAGKGIGFVAGAIAKPVIAAGDGLKAGFLRGLR